MTAAEMLLRFEQKLKNADVKDFDIQRLTLDISYYLSVSQRNLVEYYYSNYEDNEKSRKVLSTLVYNTDLTRTSVSSTQTGHHPYGEYWDLPTDSLYVLKEEATLNIDSCGDVSLVPANFLRVYVKPVNIDYYNKHIGNPFKKPYKNLVWRLDITNGTAGIHELITEELTGIQVYKYHITYIKTPVDISIESDTDSELIDWIHEDIVDGAVRLALASTINNNNLNAK